MSKTDDRNAGGVVAGFIYQIYYFLYQLLTLGVGETVSLEKFEDVGVEKGNDKTYYQLKHTAVTTGAHVERMKDRDTDLWKTLSMWIDKIKDGRDVQRQQDWIHESEFILLSNKSTDDNTFFQKVEDYQKKGDWEALKKYIEKQAEKGERSIPKNIYDYTKDVNEYPLLKEFLLKVRPEFKSDDDILDDIEYWLVNQQHFKAPNAKVLRATLYGMLCEMLRGKKVEFNLESFHDKFGELFTKIKERKFVPKNRKVSVPVEPRKQMFIRQLLDIDDVLAKTKEDIEELTFMKLEFENDYNDALAVGDDDDRINFEREVKALWKKHHRTKNNAISASNSEEEIKQVARTVLEGVRNEHPKFDQDTLNETSSNGCFYHFSDGENPRIGWRYDWKERYNGEEWTIE